MSKGSSSLPLSSWKILPDLVLPLYLRKLSNDHPLRIAARTYTLSLSLSLGPALLQLLLQGKKRGKTWERLVTTLKRELSPFGFAFAMTTAIGGAATIGHWWESACHDIRNKDERKNGEGIYQRIKKLILSQKLSIIQRTFISNAFTAAIAIILLQSRRRSLQTRKASIPLAVPITPPRNLADKKTSTTLDLTLLLLVRALDSFVQGLFLQSNAQPKSNNLEEDRQKSKQLRQKAAILTDKLDAFIFWAASARIMWCFFYLPERLPYSYVKWIGALANVDKRLLEALRGRRNGTWTYGNETFHELLVPLATELGYPPAWGDTMLVPSSGRNADKMWKALGLSDREGIGGIPCQLVHGNVGSTLIKGGAGASCTANALIRGALGFLEAIAIYAPVHFLPILLSRPNGLLQIRVLKKAIYALFRSSLFLSVFISSIWSAVCITRTLAIPRLFPRLSHNFIDGPYGCVLAGCLMCGGSIWIEQGKRRGEIALYVLPRALRTILEESWLKSGSRSLILLERLTFVLSLSSIMTAARHYPETLRGLSRWGALFVLEGLKRKF